MGDWSTFDTGSAGFVPSAIFLLMSTHLTLFALKVWNNDALNCVLFTRPPAANPDPPPRPPAVPVLPVPPPPKPPPPELPVPPAFGNDPPMLDEPTPQYSYTL